MKKKKISKKANLIICAVAFVIMIVYLVFVDSIDHVVAALSKINKGALIICVVFMIGYWLSEASTIHVMLKSMHPKMKFWNSWLTTIIGQYFNCITPSSTGGQPMQAYYLVKFGGRKQQKGRGGQHRQENTGHTQCQRQESDGEVNVFHGAKIQGKRHTAGRSLVNNLKIGGAAKEKACRKRKFSSYL